MIEAAFLHDDQESQKDQPGDFSTILSSEMISDIVEAYFNKNLYKKPVKVVDLKPTSNGYMFILAFVQVRVTSHELEHTTNGVEPTLDKSTSQNAAVTTYTRQLMNEAMHDQGIHIPRDNKGKFVSSRAK